MRSNVLMQRTKKRAIYNHRFDTDEKLIINEPKTISIQKERMKPRDRTEDSNDGMTLLAKQLWMTDTLRVPSLQCLLLESPVRFISEQLPDLPRLKPLKIYIEMSDNYS